MKKELLKTTKIIILGLIVVWGASFVLAQPVATPTNVSGSYVPINTGPENQRKNSVLPLSYASLFDLGGYLTSDSLLVSNTLDINSYLSVGSLSFNLPNSDKRLCVSRTGKLKWCQVDPLSGVFTKVPMCAVPNPTCSQYGWFFTFVPSGGTPPYSNIHWSISNYPYQCQDGSVTDSCPVGDLNYHTLSVTINDSATPPGYESRVGYHNSVTISQANMGGDPGATIPDNPGGGGN